MSKTFHFRENLHRLRRRKKPRTTPLSMRGWSHTADLAFEHRDLQEENTLMRRELTELATLHVILLAADSMGLSSLTALQRLPASHLLDIDSDFVRTSAAWPAGSDRRLNGPSEASPFRVTRE